MNPATWLAVAIGFCGFVIASAYEERTDVERQRVEQARLVEQREQCKLALQVQYDRNAYPFRAGDGIVKWQLPSQCQGYEP